MIVIWHIFLFLIYEVYFYELKPIHDLIMFALSQALCLVNSKLAVELDPLIWIRNYLDKVIDLRSLCDSPPPNDYLQIITDAAAASATTAQKTTTNLNEHETNAVAGSMSMNEIKSNLLLFMLAGYETSTFALSYCCYVLATHPDELAKLQDEIDETLNLIDSETKVKRRFNILRISLYVRLINESVF